MTKKAEEIANAHWEWLGSMLKKVYVDAFIHGYKHGADSKQ